VAAAGFVEVDRLRGVAAGFVVARFAVDAFAVERFAVAAAADATLPEPAVAADATLPEPAVAAGVAVAVGTELAAATGVVAEERGFLADAGRLRAPTAGLAAARRRVEVDLDRDGAPAWRPRIPSMSAASSAISSRTSTSRKARFSRLFFVAFSSRPARHVSSERAAASANSSHSMWRASAAAGVITAVVVSVMSSPSSKFPPHILADDGPRRDRRSQLATR
jgi:hypothetical protein